MGQEHFRMGCFAGILYDCEATCSDPLVERRHKQSKRSPAMLPVKRLTTQLTRHPDAEQFCASTEVNMALKLFQGHVNNHSRACCYVTVLGRR